MNRKPLYLLALLMALLPLPGAAVGDFYFLARTAPLGSLSAPGQNTLGVYLRWDTLEVALPEDVQHFRVLRNGQLLVELPAHQVMLAREIEALYQGVAQQRRLRETLTALKRQALESPATSDFQLSDFGRTLRARLRDPDDRLWPLLASRADFNIARARYRAYLDQPPAGEHEYELLAVNAAGETRRLGLAKIDSRTPHQILPPRDFRQVLQGQCDELESGKDHHTVSLSWQGPGTAGFADQYAAQLNIAGYDLYRSRQNLERKLPEAPPRDLAAEAAQHGHDGQGRINFQDLEKVNDVLLTIDGTADGKPVFIETRDQLAAAGLEPGDRRLYYLVARDFAGQYGSTLGTIVQVPDRGRPPPPWDVTVYNDEAAQNSELIWDAINLDNYLAAYGSGIQLCNTAQARETGRLAIVQADQSCDADPQRPLRTDVTGYRVYRFEDVNRANAFKDSDGDGVSDALERPGGTQCDDTRQPNQAENHLLPGVQVRLGQRELRNGHAVISMRDSEPAQNKPVAYWYRIASRTDDGRLSQLSATVRVVFPERDLTAKPDLKLETDDLENCGCRLQTLQSSAPWGFFDRIDRSDSLGIDCGQIELDVDEADIAVGGQGACRDLAKDCLGGTVSLRYPGNAAADEPSCSATFPADVDFCAGGEVELVTGVCPRVPIGTGQWKPGPVHVTATPKEAGSCVSMRINIGGRYTEIASNCGSENPGALEHSFEDVSVCGYAQSLDGDGNVSPAAWFGCFSAGDGRAGEQDRPPVPPQPVALEMAQDHATVRWRLPPEPVAATMIELTRQQDGHTLLQSVGIAEVSNQATDTPAQREVIGLDQLPALAPGEQWCVRFRLIPPGLAGQTETSEWSRAICDDRATDVPPPDYMPWPTVPVAPELEPANFVIATEHFTGRHSPESALPAWRLAALSFSPKDCDLQDLGGAVNADGTPPLYLAPKCTSAGTAAAAAALASALPLAVFRQGERPDGTRGDYVQVSPRLDFAHWDEIEDFAQGQAENGGTRTVQTRFVRQLNDPWLQVVAADSGPLDFELWFVDRYPVLPGHRYRYQVVHFRPDNSIRGWRQSQWVSVGAQGEAGP